MNYISDLILEVIKERNIEANKELCVSHINKYQRGISCEKYIIENEKQAKFYNKNKGIYDLISMPDVLYLNNDDKKYITSIIAKRLSQIIKVNKDDKILVVGLGNRHISSDSLGVGVVSGVNITINCKHFPTIMAICPSVMGLTGIETATIVDGVIDKIKPTHIILIDSLCAGDISRLGKSIQISNTTICPGSGIGNNRLCIGGNFKGKIVSIGVPLLIYASTLIRNAFNDNNINLESIDNIMQETKKLHDMADNLNFYESIKNVYNSKLDGMIVSIKDIAECVEILSGLISSALNKVLGVDSINI